MLEKKITYVYPLKKKKKRKTVSIFKACFIIKYIGNGF